MKQIVTIVAACMLRMLAHAQSDVDTRIAVNDLQDPNTFVLVISNENYKYEQPVPFAQNDGETFKLYCEKTLGVPEKNIRYAADATLNDMRMQLQWLAKVMKAYGGEARAIVYYSGHGMPSEDGKHAYLLPVDGNSSLAESGLSIANLYKQLGEMPSLATMVFLDACFSGARRDGQMLTSSRGVVIKPKAEPVSGNMVVFSAAQGDETAYPYKEKQHGLFTYYILEQLQEQGGYVSLGELADNVMKLVSRTSIVENNKSQSPTVTASTTAQDWRKWVLTHKRASKYETVRRTTPITQIATQPQQPVIPQSTIAQQNMHGLVVNVGYVSFTMIPVKGGMFTMGATAEQGSAANDNEKPAHKVVLGDYYIGETEVTQELWETVMGNNPSNFKGAVLPVEQVSWDDCQQFIAKLNQMTGRQFRLPTEAEWEFAARGGSLSKGYKYSGSNNIRNVAWYKGNGNDRSHEVKTKHANELGLYDMSGNVFEWCQDWYEDSYSTMLQTNPQGPSSGSCRVIRDGNYFTYAKYCRVSRRDGSKPSVRSLNLGFRLAL